MASMNLTDGTIGVLSERDMEAILRLRESTIRGLDEALYPVAHLDEWLKKAPVAGYRRLMRVGCLWGAWCGGHLIGMAGLNLAHRELVALYVTPRWQGQGIGKRLIAQVEKAACAFAITRLSVRAVMPAVGLYQRLGYHCTGEAEAACLGLQLLCQPMTKSLRRRLTRFQRQVLECMQALQVPSDYGVRHALPIQPEPQRLSAIGPDIYQRPQRMHPAAARAWRAMQRHAEDDGITLQVVSAFRSVDYQRGIILRKREAGQNSEQIFAVSAAPGFSEHHSGRALDLTTPGVDVLTEAFAGTAAYRWLQQNAASHGFHESYPRDNPHHITWEPWHWAWKRG